MDAFEATFGGGIEVFFVYNGTAANVLGLKSATRSFNSIICAETAHINVDECAAPEKFCGSKLLSIPTEDGKLRPLTSKNTCTDSVSNTMPNPRSSPSPSQPN